ncbi:unnamed protein product, partial [Closterium sp. NIES-54]
MPGYWPSEAGPYDWDADQRQRNVLFGARERGANIFEAFSNSPPWWMTVSGDVAGASEKNQPNLQPQYEGKFVDYLTTVVEKFAKDPAWNLTFDTLEPFNEPLENFWNAGNGQEGCNFDVPAITRVLWATLDALKKKGLQTKVAAFDSWTEDTVSAINSIARMNEVKRINVHGYMDPAPSNQDPVSYTTQTYSKMRDMAKGMGKEVWVSESGPMGRFGQPFDLSLYMARNVIETVNILQASAYVYWLTYDSDPRWAMIHFPWNYPAGDAALNAQVLQLLVLLSAITHTARSSASHDSRSGAPGCSSDTVPITADSNRSLHGAAHSPPIEEHPLQAFPVPSHASQSSHAQLLPLESLPVQSPLPSPPIQSLSLQSPRVQSPFPDAASNAAPSAGPPSPASEPVSEPGPEPAPGPRSPAFQNATALDDSTYLNVSCSASAGASTKSRPPAPTLRPPWERLPFPHPLTLPSPPIPRLGNYIGGFPRAAMDPLLDLMFLPSGLNLNIVRFNIGGGSLPQYSPQLHSDALLRWRAMPGYWPAQAAGFNWTADSRQQAVLLGAKARGVSVFEAFSNSPPWWMTASKDVAGGKKTFQTNLLPKYEGRFAKYLVEVVERFKTDPALGNIEFDTLEPFNEALEGHWLKGMGQEGCNFNVVEMTRIIFKTLRLLREKKLNTKLAGVDSFPGMTALWFPLLVGKIFLHRVNVHGYTLPIQQVVNMTASVAEKTYAARYVAMKVLAKSLGKEIWVSESGPLNKFGNAYDLSLYMMRNVIETVNILGISAYVYWQIFDPNDTWSLISLNWYYPPGYTGSRPLMVPMACRHTVAAFYSNEKRTVSVFIVNQRVRDKVVNVRLS